MDIDPLSPNLEVEHVNNSLDEVLPTPIVHSEPIDLCGTIFC